MADHYEGITPDQRWRNDLLRELRELNQNLRPQGSAEEKELVDDGTKSSGRRNRNAKR